MKAAFINEGYSKIGGRNSHIIDRVFAKGRREKLEGMVDLHPEIITSSMFDTHRGVLRELDVVFSSWGFPRLNSGQLDLMPNLKAVFYAAGASSSFRQPLLERGILLSTAAAANAIPVAEFALAQIFLAGAGYFRNSRECTDPWHAKMINSWRGHGNFENRVAVLGNGTVSRKLQQLLSNHDLEVLVVASRREERTVSLEEAFSTCFAVVNLFPDVEDNGGIYDRPLFESMIEGAVFINCGRGRQVDEADLIAVMKQRPDLTALLDVQWPEPPLEGSELYSVPNIRLSSHIAGAKASEFVRLADFMIEDFQRFAAGEPLKYTVKPDQL